MEAGKRTINDIFNGNRILEIPFFQRSYVWGNVQWERFLQDMEFISESNKPYFLGSVILKQQTTDSKKSVGDVRTVIDGQQRLTTINIFFKVLCLKTNTNNTFDRVFKLINNDIALEHNHNDVAVFNKVISLDEESELEGSDGITQAYNYFKTYMDITKLSFNTILSNVMFVGIDLIENEDEQQIFDTINSLGVRLTTAELLKNHFFDRNDIESYESNWKEVFEKDNETKEFWDREITAGRLRRNNIDLFFYSFLQIKLQDAKIKVRTEDKKRLGKVEGLFESYKHFMKSYNINRESFIVEIKEYADLYRKNIEYDVVDKELTKEFGIERVNAIIFGLENTTLLPYILFVLHEVKDKKEQQNIFEYIEAYIMKRIVCHASNKNYNRLFSEELIANNAVKKSSLKDLIEKKSDKANYMPSEDDLKKGFNESKLINKQSAGILYFIESRIRNRAIHSTALLGLNRYSLEHIMPKKWENNWNSISTEEERIKRNKKLLTLGNLTIITSSLNSSIRDADWITKKNGKKDKKGLLDYSSGVDTIKDYLTLEEWDEKTIENRAEFLFEKARDMWK